MRVILRSATAGTRWLEFAQPKGRRFFSCVATLHIDGEEHGVELEMIDVFRADMLGFFEELATESAGWAGAKRWRSEFAEMWIEATHERDYVSLSVGMWAEGDEWETTAVLDLSADRLQKVAAEMRLFVGLPLGERFRRSLDSQTRRP